jgi:hypothetical protein
MSIFSIAFWDANLSSGSYAVQRCYGVPGGWNKPVRKAGGRHRPRTALGLSMSGVPEGAIPNDGASWVPELTAAYEIKGRNLWTLSECDESIRSRMGFGDGDYLS